jgi:tripartite-type tricarboxylate transporter receptor subunit TctC
MQQANPVCSSFTKCRGVLSVIVALIAASATAQTFPSKPLRFIVPFPPGGGTDLLARAMAGKLREALGQPVVIDNRGGAGGVVGTELAARAAPDGHTLLLGSPGSLTINPHLGKLSYDPVRDFAPVVQATLSPFTLTAHPAVPVNSVKDVIALAKAKPGMLNYGTSGSGAMGHLAGEEFKLLTGVNIVHVPFKGSAIATTALIGGEVQFTFENLPVALPHARNGKLKILAVGSLERSPMAPELPTMREAGVPGYEAVTSFGVVVPAHTPRVVVDRLNRELVRILRDTDVREPLASRGMEIVAGSPEAYAEYLQREFKLFGEIIRKANIRME